jgi:hypothetical protein
MNKVGEIEKLKNLYIEESNKDTPDVNILYQLKRKMIQIGLGLNFNDIYKQ